MATFVALAPNVTLDIPAAWSVVGAANAHTALLSQDAATSYVAVIDDDQSDVLRIGHNTYALAADERSFGVFIQIQLHINVNPGASGGVTWALAKGPSDPVNRKKLILSFGGYTYGTWAVREENFDIGTTEWLQADIDAIETRLAFDYGSAGPTCQLSVSWIRAAVWVFKRPLVDINVPTPDQVVNTKLPAVFWTYTGFGEVQSSFQAKIFPAAVAEAPGFDPTNDPGWVHFITNTGATTAWGPPATPELSYGAEYYYYVRAAKNGAYIPLLSSWEQWYSEWDSVPFRIKTRPTTAITSPLTGGSVFDTNKPVINWTYTDELGVAQDRYQIKVWQRPGASWTGFDPDTTVLTPIWDSGEVASATTSVQVAAALANNTNYRAYLKVRQTAGEVIYSLWNFTEFNTQFVTAPTPTLALVPPSEHSVTLTVTPGLSVGNRGLFLPGLSAANASAPDTAGLSPVGDLDMRFKVAFFDWTPDVGTVTIASKWNATSNQRSWIFELTAAGNLQLRTSSDGTNEFTFTSSVATGLAASATKWVAYAIDVDNGAAGKAVSFYTSDDNITYTPLGTTQTQAGTTTIFNSTAPVVIGGHADNLGNNTRFYAFQAELRSLVGGTIIASPNFASQAADVRSFTDAQGNLWTVNGEAEIESPITPNPDWFVIERSIDGGATWQAFRHGTLDTTDPWQITPGTKYNAFNLTDYEPPLNNVAVKYRARSVTTQSTATVEGDNSNVITVTPTGKSIWLKDPSDSTKNVRLLIEDIWLSVAHNRQRTVYPALGRAKPLVIRGQDRSESFSITALVLGATNKVGLDLLVDLDRTLLVQTPKKNWYAEIAGPVADLGYIWDKLHGDTDVWRVSIPFQEVDF